MSRLFFLLTLLFALGASAQSNRFRAATWNLENLFDTVHDEGKDDYEFLPTAKRQWNSYRYWKKLRGISQTIAAMELPSIVGVQEVENDTVLRDLTRRTALWNAHYKYIVTNSPDSRGVDVGLLYRPEEFQLLNWHSVRVPSQENGLRPTRDILVASGIVSSSSEPEVTTPLSPLGGERAGERGSILHIIVVHLPSRQNNNKATIRNRQLAVQTLLGIVDSLKSQKILVLGDFNAEPGDPIFKKSVEISVKGSDPLTEISTKNRGLLDVLGTILPTKKSELRKEVGTYYFKGVWGYLDHMLVSEALLDNVHGQAHECRFSWLLRTEKQIPRRTYGGTSYIGGLSDHLPLVADFDF